MPGFSQPGVLETAAKLVIAGHSGEVLIEAKDNENLEEGTKRAAAAAGFQRTQGAAADASTLCDHRGTEAAAQAGEAQIFPDTGEKSLVFRERKNVLATHNG